MPSITTRDRFRGAISGAPTLNAAVSLVTAIHTANLKELLDELESKVCSGLSITEQDLRVLRNDYAA